MSFSDIRIYLVCLFLGLAFDDKSFFRIGASFLFIEITLEIITRWRKKNDK